MVPVSIGTKAELIQFQKDIYSGALSADTDAKLTADIDLGGTPWTPVHVPNTSGYTSDMAYSGTFDGDGHVISGLNLADVEIQDQSCSGLFLSLGTEGVIKNLTLSGNVSNGKTVFRVQVGVFTAFSSGKIENCVNLCNVDVPSMGAIVKIAGGIAGSAGGAIINCVNMGNITAAAPKTGYYDVLSGGIAGMSDNALISMCANNGTINGGYKTGGIIGDCGRNSTVQICTNTGSVSTTGVGWGGGITGYLCDSKVLNCMNSGRINSGRAGGIAGDVDSLSGENTISNCTNMGEVRSYKYSYTSPESRNMAGGIAGYAKKVFIVSSTNTGKVSSEANEACDIAGYLTGSPSSAVIANCGFSGETACSKDTTATVHEASVISADAALLNEKAVTTLTVVPSMLLKPEGKGSFDITVNGRAVTEAELNAYGITPITSGDKFGENFAEIGNFINGTAAVNAKALGVAGKGYHISFKPTDFEKFLTDNGAVSSDIMSHDFSLFVTVADRKTPLTPSGGGSGGCSAGFAALALLAAIPVIIRKKH